VLYNHPRITEHVTNRVCKSPLIPYTEPQKCLIVLSTYIQARTHVHTHTTVVMIFFVLLPVLNIQLLIISNFARLISLAPQSSSTLKHGSYKYQVSVFSLHNAPQQLSGNCLCTFSLQRRYYNESQPTFITSSQ
jgi:hypothetical protein